MILTLDFEMPLDVFSYGENGNKSESPLTADNEFGDWYQAKDLNVSMIGKDLKQSIHWKYCHKTVCMYDFCGTLK